ncbi:glycosyltransferase family 2 protein [Actinomycetes bacterium KLBMP 9797]
MHTESPISVVIAAHNEAKGIGRCLDALLDGAAPGEIDITVVANGCTDDTAAVAASRPGVRVLVRPEPGKAKALNAGDAVAVGFPRVYLDADIVLPRGALRALAAALTGDALAAVPRRQVEVRGRPLLIRAYYAINSRLPAYERALFGRGAIALSAAGRARFDAFPDVVADDLYLDSLFAPAEKRQVEAVTARIATPRRTRDLVRRLARVRSGNTAIRAAATGVRRAARSSWLRDVVLPRPWLLPAGACYAAITLLAAARARRAPASAGHWGRDESSRDEVAA